MLTGTDLATLSLLAFALWHGWRIGLLRSLLGPIGYFCFFIIAIINFDLNKNIAVATLIMIIGATASSTLIRIILWLSRRTVDKESRYYVFWGSRVLGSWVSAVWKLTLFSVGVLLITLLPPPLTPGLPDLQKDILSSQTYFYLDHHVLPRSPWVQNVYLALRLFQNSSQLQTLSETREYKEFFNSAKIQALFSDDGIKAYLAGKNFELIFTHPKVKNVITDDYLMELVFRLSRMAYQERMKITAAKP